MFLDILAVNALISNASRHRCINPLLSDFICDSTYVSIHKLGKIFGDSQYFPIKIYSQLENNCPKAIELTFLPQKTYHCIFWWKLLDIKSYTVSLPCPFSDIFEKSSVSLVGFKTVQ